MVNEFLTANLSFFTNSADETKEGKCQKKYRSYIAGNAGRSRRISITNGKYL